MADIVQKVLTVYKADTSDAKAAIKGLRGEEANAARARLDEINKGNAGIEGQIAMWGKVALAVGAGVAAYKIAQAAANSYLEDLRLESAAAGVNVGKLNEATIGLIESDKLLEFAGKAQNGVWKLNQQEMETVLKGATALRKTMGVELAPTVDALTEAVSKGSTRALKEFGIEAKDKQDVLKQLGELYAKTGGDVALAGDDFLAANTKISDSFDDIAGALGRLVIALGPVMSFAAEGISNIAIAIQRAGEGLRKYFTIDDSGSRTEQAGEQFREIDKNLRLAQAGINPDTGAYYFDKEARDLRIKELTQDRKHFLGYLKEANKVEADAVKAAADLKNKAIKDAEEMKNARLALDSFYSLTGSAGENKKRTGGRGKKKGAGIDGGGDEDLWALTEGYDDSGLQDLIASWGTGDVAQIQDNESVTAIMQSKSGSQSVFESVFGTPEEMNEYSAGFSLMSVGLSTLAQATQDAFASWYDNETSITETIKNITKTMMRALAMEMWANSLKYFASGVGELFWNPAKAAGSFKAAALFAAGAVAIGAVAHGTGLAGASSGSSGAGAPSSGDGQSAGGFVSGGGSSQPADKSITIVLDDAWYGRTRTERAADMARAINQAKRGTSHIRRR